MRTYNNTFVLSKSEIAALVEFASDDTARPALASVMFRNDGHAVATDGHRLVVAESPFGEKVRPAPTADALISADDLAGWGKRLKKGEVLALRAAADKWALAVVPERYSVVVDPADVDAWFAAPTFIKGEAPSVDAKFPPYEQVIPAPGVNTPASSVGFNAAYLAALHTITKASGNDRSNGVTLALGGVMDPMRADVAGVDGTTFTAIVMPMRVDGPPPAKDVVTAKFTKEEVTVLLDALGKEGSPEASALIKRLTSALHST